MIDNLDNIKKELEKNPALAHVCVHICYYGDFEINSSLQENENCDKLKDNWAEEFEKISDAYEIFVLRSLEDILGRNIVGYHADDMFIMEFGEIDNEDTERKLLDCIKSLGCNVEFINSDETNFKFVVRELNEDSVVDIDKYNLFVDFINCVEFYLPLTNQLIYDYV